LSSQDRNSDVIIEIEHLDPWELTRLDLTSWQWDAGELRSHHPKPTYHSGRFREVLGNFCSGIAVITSLDDGQPVGFACQSFQSLSLDPPLVTFSPSRTSSTWPRIQRSGGFAVNILAEHQGEVCAKFAISGGDKFAGVEWRSAPSGAPLIEGALAWLDCSIVATHPGGDHVIVVGRVNSLDIRSTDNPLLFFRSGFRRLVGE
jgi:3-hydroxy-9,10-secoandrosta-1,3,5(10)-triene-9,17-dione monooxygenase reductase component